MHNGSDNIHCESSHSAKWGVSVYSILFFFIKVDSCTFFAKLVASRFLFTSWSTHAWRNISHLEYQYRYLGLSLLFHCISDFSHLIRTTITTTTTGDSLTHKRDSQLAVKLFYSYVLHRTFDLERIEVFCDDFTCVCVSVCACYPALRCSGQTIEVCVRVRERESVYDYFWRESECECVCFREGVCVFLFITLKSSCSALRCKSFAAKPKQLISGKSFHRNLSFVHFSSPQLF